MPQTSCPGDKKREIPDRTGAVPTPDRNRSPCSEVIPIHLRDRSTCTFAWADSRVCSYGGDSLPHSSQVRSLTAYMSWLERRDRRNQEAVEREAELHRVVTAPDGSRYEIVAEAKDWHLGTGSVLLDTLALAWAVVRRARGKEFVVSVRRTASGSETLVTRHARTPEEAGEIVAETAVAVENGHYATD
jgi:hypothetical protein